MSGISLDCKRLKALPTPRVPWSTWPVLALLIVVLAAGLPACASESAAIIRATDCGLAADGVTDDGPAIQRMLKKAASATGPVILVFPENKTIRVTTAQDRYVLRFHRSSDVTVDGRGSTFLLGPDVRFLRLTHSSRYVMRNLNVDFHPLPFVDGTVVAVNATERHIDVRVPHNADDSDKSPLPSGGATRQDGEQAFFGMLWQPGPYGLVSTHYWVDRMEPLAGPPHDDAVSPRVVRVYAGEDFHRFNDVKPDESRISLPVPGIAHRFGPGACFELWDNDTVSMENVELWSAPWFGFSVFRNRGRVTFSGVHIRPKPNSGRLTSTWRDGFHVKGNSATLLWEDCIVAGTNDDAYNLSNHSSRVRAVISPTRIVVQQIYPLNVMPWHEGETLAAADADAHTLLGRSLITKVTHSPMTRTIGDRPAASPVTLELERPIPALEPGAMVWEPAFANPNTTLRRCRIEKSCRLQTPVTLESCDVTAFLWFYGEGREGPFPSDVVLSDCSLRRGRGNTRLAVSFRGRIEGAAGASAIYNVSLTGNRIWGDLSLRGVDDVRIEGNEFCEPGAKIELRDIRRMTAVGNRDEEGKPLTLIDR